MFTEDGGKRKRLVQSKLDEIFKKKRVGESSKTDTSMSDEDVSNTVAEQSGQQPNESKLSPSLLEEETQRYELFDSEDSYLCSIDCDELDEPVRLGVPLETLHRTPDCCRPLPSITTQPGHIILFRLHIQADKPPRPYPDMYRDTRDRHHVFMPCSKESLYPDKNFKKKLISRWELIRSSLRRPMASSCDLQDAILSYNVHHAKRWNFATLHSYFLERASKDEQTDFFNLTLPAMIDLALQLPTICTQAIPFLKRQRERTLCMTQQQVACLLANAFLCTYPRRSDVRNPDQLFGEYPDINFSRLFQGTSSSQGSSTKAEKLRCLLHYFKRVTQRPPLGTISFKRQVLKPDETPTWHRCPHRLCRLRVSSDGAIEDDAPGLLQVDFANMLVGGGILGEGCVQEEIRFAICPELIISRLFTERLEENECLIITGAERFSNYTGYAKTFKWVGNHDDRTPRDNWGRRFTEIVAIDARYCSNTYSEQFSPVHIKRELEKAYCGFLARETQAKNLPAVATGKWGCGAFQGDCQLKSIIQLMAASVAGRDLMYFTFDDKEHATELYELHCLLKEKNITVGNLWQILNDYKKQLVPGSRASGLFPYIHNILETTSENQSDVGDRVSGGNNTDIDDIADRMSPSLLDGCSPSLFDEVSE